jgi:hypothetical protein
MDRDGPLALSRFRAHIPGMTNKTKLYLILIGFWVVSAALSFWIVGYDQTIRILPFAVTFLVFGLAILWWSLRGKDLEPPTRQP